MGPTTSTNAAQIEPTDLPAAAVAALDDPPEPVARTVEAAGIPFHALAWGDPALPPLLLIHGVTASARIWWRIGPALAAGLDRHVAAVDQAGHGRTGRWTGHWGFRDNASDLASFTEAAGLAHPALAVVGHSWGAMTAAALPAAGLRPDVLVLLDPPTIPAAWIASMLDDPIERRFDDLAEALATVVPGHAAWAYGDVLAKAEGLTQFDAEAVRAILTLNGDWDGGLASLADPAAADIPLRLVRGDPASGGLVPESALPDLAARIGAENIETIPGGGHSPMRLRPLHTLAALLRALS